MDIYDYLYDLREEIENSDDRTIMKFVCELAKKIIKHMPPSGREGILVAQKFIAGQESKDNLVKQRVAIWEDHDKNYRETQKGHALRVIICGLFYPIKHSERFGTVVWAIDFCHLAAPELTYKGYQRVIDRVFKTDSQ